MPIDASIPLSVRPVQLDPDAFTRAFQIAQQTSLQRENQAALRDQRDALAEQRRLEADRRRQDAADRQAQDDALQQGAGVRGATLAWATANAPHAIPTLTKFFDDSDKSALEIGKLQDELNQKRLDHVGHLAENILTHGATPEAIQTGLSLYAEQFPSEKDQVSQIAQRLQGLPPEQVKGFLEQTRDGAPYWQSKQAKNTPQVVAPGGTLVDDAGKVLYSAPAKEDHSPAYKEYQDAVSTGYKGSFTQYQNDDANRHKPVVNVNTAGAGAGALDADGLDYAATEYRVTGRMPALGMGNGQARAAIVNGAAKQAKALGQSPAAAIQRQAAQKADGASLTKMTAMKSAAESFEMKATAQADKVVELSNKVDRTSWPLVNAAILAGKTEIAGNSQATQLLNAVSSFTAEYAKIVEGSTGSSQGSSDAARRMTERLLNAKMSKGTVKDVVDLMKWEMSQTVKGYDATIGHISERMGGNVPAAAPASGGVTEGAQQAIPGVPGGVAEYRGGKWIRVK